MGWRLSRVENQQASAEVLWDCLEAQRDPGLNAPRLMDMDDALHKLLPFRRSTVKRRTREGLELVEVVRHFDSAKAIEMLEAIGYPDCIADLRTIGYEATKARFIRRAVRYAQAEQIQSWYAR